jgi:uncharacterized membrane protein
MTRKLLISAAAASTAVALVAATAGTALAAGDRGFGMHRDRGGHPIFGILVLAVVAGLAILGTWLVLGKRRTAAGASLAAAAPLAAPVTVSPTANAEAILAERLARSEISPDDYRTALAALREPASVGGPGATPDAT